MSVFFIQVLYLFSLLELSLSEFSSSELEEISVINNILRRLFFFNNICTFF